MLPLIPIALEFLPTVAGWIFGDKGKTTAQAVSSVVAAVTGTDDPEAARMALQDPAKATELRIKLAEITAQAQQAARQADLDELKAQLADVASARAQTVSLANQGSATAYGSMILSAIVLVSFGTMLFMVVANPNVGTSQVAVGMLGILGAMSTQVGNYWLGSSAGSRAKQGQVESLAQLAATQVPAELLRR